MGNSNCGVCCELIFELPCDLKLISFESKITHNKTNIYVIKGDYEVKILENIEKNDEKFIHALNLIKN